MDRYIVDRIEGNIVVLEKTINEYFNVNISEMPLNVNEGDVLSKKDNKFIIDLDLTKAKKKELFELQNKLFSD
ncbi:MAG: DUF3006 domain-containing protein [Oscillospiraceae bacterium]